MNRTRYQPCCHLLLLALVLILGLTANSWSQKPPAPGQPNPQAPTLNMPVPLGTQRGSTLELTLTGTNLAEPTGLWTSFPAKVSIPTDNNNGKDNAKLRVQLEVPKDAPLGFHSIRLATTRGMSNFRVFCLDDLPAVQEVDSNRSRSTAQAVPIPSVVIGRSDAEVSDYFKIQVQAGQRVSFEVLGRRLGSALDPQLSLYDVRTGRELPAGHSNDAPGLQTDPRLTYTFKEAGEYLLEVRDVMYRGGADYWYRLRIGDFPCATVPLPMAARRGSQVTVQFAGPVVEGVAPIEVFVPNDPATKMIWLTPRGANGLHGWPVALGVSDLEEATEREPNQEPAKANRIAVPGGITARFQESGDVDQFVFQAKKGQRHLIEAHTHELYSPTEVYMVLKDAKGTQLAVTTPATAPRLDFRVPADGDYYLTVEHLLYWSGPSEVYRVTVTPYEPGFDLSLALDRLDIAQGGRAALGIIATRRDYTGPIEVSVLSPPGLTGQMTIPPGPVPPRAQRAAAQQPPQPAAQLFLSAAPDLPLQPYELVIQGRAVINGKLVVTQTAVRAAVSQSMAGLTYPPRQFTQQIGIALTEKAPFSLSAKLDQPEGLRGSPVSLTISANRTAGFAEEIALTPLGLPANVAPALKSIPKGQNEVKVQLTPAANAALGQFPISFAGKGKFKNRDFTETAPPVTLVLALPFDLKFEPSTVKLAPGEKHKVQVIATRKGGYQGPIDVELKNLPGKVTAPKATIPMGQTTVEVEVTAAPDATASKAEVNIQGTATAAANQQVASAKFTVSVQLPAPFELRVEPSPLKLTPGSKTKVKVTATRTSYQGPITVELRNLPAQVTAPKATIDMGQTTVEIEVTAADTAAVGDKADINVLGVATGAANQQQASPNFTVSIGKK